MAERGRIEIVEVLRGLAALGVSWFHMTNTYQPGIALTSGSFGWLGVEVFFVISGFIVPYALFRRFPAYSLKDFPTFCLRRLIRLEPPYILSVALTLGLWYLSTIVPGFAGLPTPFDFYQIAAHFCYLIPMTEYQWLQPVYWTLAYEFAFYLLVGLLFGLVGSDRRHANWLVAGALVLGFVLSGLLPDRSLLFVLGFGVFRLVFVDRGQRQKLLTMAIMLICWAGLALKLVLSVALAGGLATLAILFGSGITFHHNRAGRSLLWLGSISYSLYLVHVPIGGRVVNLAKRFAISSAYEILISLLGLAAAIAFAALFSKLVEKPATRLASRITGERGGKPFILAVSNSDFRA